MTDDGVSSPVRTFITEHIRSVMQLELLLLLASQPTACWTAAGLAREMRIDPAWVEVQLRNMASQGLLRVQDTDKSVPQYQYSPSTAELADRVRQVAGSYASRRVTVISYIFAQPLDPLRSFADSFRLRKDRSDG